MVTQAKFGTYVFACVLAAGLLAAPAAQAVQTSGSLVIILDKTEGIINGDVINASVYLHNSSTNSPILGVPPAIPNLAVNGVNATLTGDVTVDFNCPDCACANNNVPFTLSFMAGAAGGCVTRAGAFVTCAGAGANQAVISLGAGSIAAPPDGTTFIAQIKFTAAVPNGVLNLPNVIQASSEACALRACENNVFPCVDCGAQGCTEAFATFEQRGCPHPCPSVITCNDPRPDTFTFHTLIDLPAGLDPSTLSFTASLTNVNGQVFTPAGGWVLGAGALAPIGDGWKFTDPAAKNAHPGGIMLVQLHRRDGFANRYRLDVQVADDAIGPNTSPNSNPALAPMTFEVKFGAFTQTFGPNVYDPKEGGCGWVFNP